MEVATDDKLTLRFIDTNNKEEVFSLEKSSTEDGLFIFHYNNFTTVISSLIFTLDRMPASDTELRLYRDDKLIGVIIMPSINSKLRKVIKKFMETN